MYLNTNSVLFVCSMNICRSPLMAGTLGEVLAENGPDACTITSRGVVAARGNEMCPRGAEALSGSHAGRAFAQHHASSPLSMADLTSSQLVIVASRAERASIARRAPALRPRTFTLHEAHLLGEAKVSRRELDTIEGIEETHGAPLPLMGFAELLHRRRGTLVVSQRTGWLHRHSHPFDLPDAHLGKGAPHQRMLRTLRLETQQLGSSYLSFRALRTT